MKPDCRQFRARLADALRASPAAPAAHVAALGELQWQGHVVHCAACQALLAEEEALDELLRSLPQPHLPRALAERVLSRLDGARRADRGRLDLDRLLELSLDEPPPADLARGVIARVHAEQRLDRLLESLPAPIASEGLGRRVLARLELARRSSPVLARPAQTHAPRTWHARPLLRAAAGFALIGLAAWAAWSLRREGSPRPTPEIVSGPGAPGPAAIDPNTQDALPSPQDGIPPAIVPDEQLLASLEMFEAWDLLASTSGLDASLATLDSMDEYLLDFGAAPALPAGSEAAPPEEPSTVPETAPKGVKQG